MNKLFPFLAIVALTLLCSCQKQQTEVERAAEVERQVQQRLEAERQAQEKEQLAEREGDLAAREKALAEEENAAAKTRAPEIRTTRPEQRTVRTDERRPTASYDIFYTKLESHGDWRETSDYGYVWQPREAEQSRNWRPYTNGHWVYTDAGWTWVSEEPFGWATYHYGRWTRLRNIGWVWVPGDEWAPAWVSWRKSNDYVGWAPLPPEARFDRRTGIHNWSDNYYDTGPDQYCFVPTNEFGSQRVERVVVPVERNVTIINQTINVTNITYNNTIIVNQGPSYDELRGRTQQPIQRLRLERDINVDVNVAMPRSVVRGEVIAIPAPVLSRAQPAERPRRIKETIAQTTVDHGWDTITDRPAADKARAKLKSEATPPPDAPSKTLTKPAQAAADASSPTPASTLPGVSSPAEVPVATATATPTPVPRSTVLPTSILTPTATPAPSATPTAAETPSATATPAMTGPRRVQSETPEPTVTPSSKSTPSAVILPRLTPSPGLSPGKRDEKSDVQEEKRGKFKSKAQEFEPRRTVPTTSPASPTPSPTPISSTSGSPGMTASPSPPASAATSPANEQGASSPFERPRVGGRLRSLRKTMEERGETPVQGRFPSTASSPELPQRQRMARPQLEPTPAESSQMGLGASPPTKENAAASSASTPAEPLKGEEKKKRKHEREATAEATATISPTPTPEPQ